MDFEVVLLVGIINWSNSYLSFTGTFFPVDPGLLSRRALPGKRILHIPSF